MKRLGVILIGIIGLLGLSWAMVAAQGSGYALDWWTVDGGGGASSVGGYTLGNSVGQPDAGSMSGGGFTLGGGFWGFGEPLPPVTIILTPLNPPIVIPPQGGSYQYHVQVTNNTDSIQSFNGWSVVEGPNDISVTLGPIPVTLQPGQSAGQSFTQQVPGNAPAGTYTHTSYVGTYPDVIIDTSESFTWEKAAGTAQGPVVPEWGSHPEAWLEK